MRTFSIGRAASPVKEAATFFLIPQAEAAEAKEPTKTVAQPPAAHPPKFINGEEAYKTYELKEMAKIWKGTVLEPHTVPLLAMLMVENGALAPQVRGDYGLAIGIEQNHICIRGFMGKHYCGHGAVARLAADLPSTPYPHYLSTVDWHDQFRHYSDTVMGMVKLGMTDHQIITSWNPGEVGRIGKVKSHKSFVAKALEF